MVEAVPVRTAVPTFDEHGRRFVDVSDTDELRRFVIARGSGQRAERLPSSPTHDDGVPS